MKEKPIIFSSEMVKAILKNRKSQTRRIIKPQPTLASDGKIDWIVKKQWQGAWTLGVGGNMTCPLGKIGDKLWVREPWNNCQIDLCACYEYCVCPPFIYRGDGEIEDQKWKSPRFMPKIASRITLEITDIRVERIQDISEEDAQKEGMPKPSHYYCDEMGGWEGHRCKKSSTFFKELWEEINGLESWNDNNWVWVIGFRRLANEK